ncbi:cupin domain-containing protein [Lysobacter arenosi]|jgi:quercetin dioxygenase-like cupin family protein|uniref:Cupin domain-containing protein n=1 Tax=Lysobacter arenosi TaxID=2795387 RepID=A0ABX7RAA7_9GAMM|nr:cupin domain-containing protein [Lysobacter arenosi]QSX74341.1 cupin domain-containing protein [Lysobacter arenosi]
MKAIIVPAMCLVGFACASLFASVACAQDMATTAGKNVKVLLDNEKVRVLELNMPPGASTGLHSHGDNVVYFVTGGTATQVTNGESKTMTRKPGEAIWSGPVTHDTTNSGKTAVKTVVIELK